MTDTITGALIGFGGAIVGAIIAYFSSKRLVALSHKNALDLLQSQNFNESASKFRTCFTEDIRLLQKDGGTNPQEFLGKAYVRHWNAVIEFSSTLNAQGQTSLNEQWQKYQNAYEDGSFSSSRKSANERKGCYALALEHILELTDCAQYK